METTAKHNDGEYEIPDELLMAHIMNRSGRAWWEIQITPAREIQNLLFLWHLEDVVSRKQRRDREREIERAGK
jgi:hypothetical protein